MKKFRKIMAVLVAAMMIMAMMVPAWAADQKIEGRIALEVQSTAGQKATYTTLSTIDVEIPAKSDEVYVELPKALPTGYTYTDATTYTDYVFLGWTETEGSTQLVDRLRVTSSDLTGDPLTKTVYAVFGDPEDVGDNNHSFTDTTGSIIINNSTPNETYTAYQLFKLYSWKDDVDKHDQHADNTEAYSYYIVKQYHDETTNTDVANPLYETLKNYSDNGNAAFTFFDNASDGDRTITATINGLSCVLTPVKATDWFINSGDDENEQDEYTPVSSSKAQKFAIAVLGHINNVVLKNDALKEALENCTLSIASTTAPATTETTTISNLPLGYYLVDSSLGSLCALDTTTKSVTVIEKNYYTSVTKAVEENSNTTYGDKNDAYFGETVKFQSTVKIPKHQSSVVYHDKINETAFELKSLEIKYDGDKLPTTNYTIYENAAGKYFHYSDAQGAVNTSDKQSVVFLKDVDDVNNNGNKDERLPLYADDTFAIAFAPSWTESDGDKVVTIEYTAKLLPGAIIGDQKNSTGTALTQGSGNDNEAWTTFGAKQVTERDWTRTYTYRFDIFKYADRQGEATYANKGAAAENTYPDYEAAAKAGYIKNPGYEAAQTAAGASAVEGKDYWIKVNPLKDAQFNVTLKGSDTKLKFSVDTTSTLATTNNGVVTVYKYDTEGTVEDLTTPASGLIYITGLDAAEYVVKEKEAPKGYDKLHKDLQVVIASDTKGSQGTNNTGMATNTVTLSSNFVGVTLTNDDKVNQVEIVNFTSKEMPSTGGMGTTVLYIVGGMLVILAGAYLFFSRKRTA